MQYCLKRMLVCLLLAIFTAGCKPDIRANILHLGDSLMSDSVAQIHSEHIMLSSAALPLFNAFGGFGVSHTPSYWVPRLSNIQDQITLDAIFISLGTNDANVDLAEMPNEGELVALIEQMLNAVAPQTQVYWILPHGNVGEAWNISEQIGRFNSALTSVANSGNWPNLILLNYDQWLASKDIEMSAAVESDGVHLNDQGRREFARMIVARTDEDFPEP